MRTSPAVRMLPFAGIEARVGGSLVAASEPEQRAEGGLVEVSLKGLGADAAVRLVQPLKVLLVYDPNSPPQGEAHASA